MLPSGPKHARAISFALMLSHIYLSFVTHYPRPWYMPMPALESILVMSLLVQQATASLGVVGRHKHTAHQGLFKKAVYALIGLTLFVNLSLTLASAYQLRLRQEIVEDGNRRQIGLWLKEHAASQRDTVFLEPLGYIGFFSQLKMYDYPGLSSPEVVAARKKLKTNSYALLIRELSPDWLVLRPEEIRRIKKDAPLLLAEKYEQVKVFDVSDKVRSFAFLPGRQYLEFDQTFTVFNKRTRQATYPERW